MAFTVFTDIRPLFQGPFLFDFPNYPQKDLGIVSGDDGSAVSEAVVTCTSKRAGKQAHTSGR
jgi:hypothetical protein